MENRLFIIMVGAFMLGTTFASAEEYNYDPMQRNLITVQGESKIVVPVNAFDILFDFDMEKGSFTEASQESQRVINTIQSSLADLEPAKIEIIKGWDLVKQGTISFGSKGKKISNIIKLRVTEFPNEKLHEYIATILDKSLPVNSGLIVKGVEVYLTEEVENAKKEELLEQAIRKLESNSARIAKGLGKKITAAKRIYVKVTEKSDPQENYLSYHSSMKEKVMYERSSLSDVSIRKRFRLQADIEDHIEMTSSIFGIYEIEN